MLGQQGVHPECTVDGGNPAVTDGFPLITTNTRIRGEAKMVRMFLGVLAMLAISANLAGAQTKIEKVPIKPTEASNPQQMFMTYCAVCHGTEGKGNGPAAAALTKVPADLTKINARNGGTFPEVRVRRFIEGADTIAAHGTRDMPIWGDLFRSLSRDTAQIRIAALTEYLKKMQQ